MPKRYTFDVGNEIHCTGSTASSFAASVAAHVSALNAKSSKTWDADEQEVNPFSHTLLRSHIPQIETEMASEDRIVEHHLRKRRAQSLSEDDDTSLDSEV